MNPQELNRVYEALQNAHNAGDTKAAEQLAQYARQLEDQTKLDTTPFASSEGGISDKYIHNPLTYGAAGFFGGMAVPEAMSKVANVVTPKPRPTPSAVPSTPSVQSAPAAVSQHPGSLGPGAVKNIQHNIGQVIGNDLHLGLARNPVPGFGLAPDALVITPNGMKGAAPAAPKARPSISAMKNAVKNTMQAQHPVPPGRLRGALSGGVAAGSAIDAVQQAREGNVLPAAASTLSTLGGVGMASKNPKVALAGGLASLLGIGGRMLLGNKEEEKEPEPPADKNWMWGGKQFAAGGVAGYSKGKAVTGALSLLGRKPAHTAAEEVKKLSDVAQGHIGKFYVPTQADRMGGVGGPSYSANQLLYPEYSGMAWGSGQPATASGLANLAKDPRFGGPEGQLFAPLLGAENMHQSNQMVFDELMKNFYKNRKALTPEMRKAINDYMQTGGTITGKKAGFEGYPGFDIADKSMIQDLGQTFEARKQIAQHAFGGQGIGGRKAQIIPYEEILRKTRDPLTEGAETFSMGPRAFKLTGETHPTPRPDLNPAYPFQLYGSDIGAAYTPVPSELSLMDFQRGWRQNTGKTMPLKSGKLPQPGYYEHTLGYTPAGSSERIYPRQQITEDWIKELQRSGFKQGGLAHMAGGGDAFKNMVKAYKLFRTKPNDPETLYPLFVNADKPVPVGEWLKAEVGPVAASGKVKSKLGELAYRPGWHAGDLPLATHIGAKSDPSLKAPDLRPPNQVWAEVDMPADVDWQAIANQRAQRNKSGLIIPRTAHITDEIPFGGHYRYKTSPNMEGNWLISGDMRVNRVLSDEEVRAINEASGMYDLPRYSPLSESYLQAMKKASGKAEGGLAHMAGGGQAYKMFQQLYRGYAGKPGAEEIFASPQKRVAEYYAQKRAAQTGLQPGVEAVQVDPFAGKQYGHALPIDQFNQDVVTTQARKLSPLDVLTPKPNRMTEFELSMAEQIDQMRQAKKAQDARLAEYYRQKAGQHTVEPRPAQDLGRSVAELAESMEARYK